MPGEHALLSPSAAARWIGCPGSMIYKKEEEKQSEYARVGSVKHAAAEYCLRNKCGAAGALGKVPDFTDDMVESVEFALDTVRAYVKENMPHIKAGVLEHRVTINEHLWGTLDVGFLLDTGALVCDFKFGTGVMVSAEENVQLMTYACAWLRDKHIPPAATVTLMIIQPMTPEPVRTWDISANDLVDWYEKVLMPGADVALQIATSGSSVPEDFHPSEKACKWCPGKGVCKYRAGAAMEDLTTAFSMFAEVEEPGCPPPPLVPVWTEENYLSVALPLAVKLEQWAKDVCAYAQTLALGGTGIPGWKLVEGRANRKWSAPDTQIAEALKGIDENIEPWEQSIIPLTQAEKLLGPKRKGLIKDLWRKPKGAPTLVPESDKRDAYAAEEHTAADFAEFAAPVAAGPASVPADELATVEPVTRGTLVRPMSAAARLAAKQSAIGLPPVAVQIYSPAPGQAKSLPRKNSVRHKIFTAAPANINDVAASLTLGVEQVKLHLKYIAERDGHTVTINTNGDYIIN